MVAKLQNMPLQYLQDDNGLITAVVVPIEEWKKIIEANAELEPLPKWQIELGSEELAKVYNNQTELMSWEETKKQLQK